MRRGQEESKTLVKRDRVAEKHAWKRDLSLRTNGSVDPWVFLLFHRLCVVSIDLLFSMVASYWTWPSITPLTIRSHGVSLTCGDI